MTHKIPEAPIDVHVRNMDPMVWRSLRAEAVLQGISVARMLQGLLEFWEDHPGQRADWLTRPRLE